MKVRFFEVKRTNEQVSSNKPKGKGFRKSTEGRAIWSLSADSEILLLTAKVIKN